MAPARERPDDPLQPSPQLEFIHAAFASLPLGLLLVDGEGAIVMANHELERVFAYPRAELIGQSVDALVPDTSRVLHADLRHAYGGNPQPRRMAETRELFGRRKDGTEVPIEVALIPVQFRGSTLILASVTDITERRRMQRGLQAMLDERLEFEVLVGELGAEFVNLEPADVNRRIEEALGRVVRTLNLDRAALFVVENDGDFVHTHQWTRPGCAPPAPRVSAQQQFPWMLAQVRASEVARFSVLEEVPDAVDRDNFRRLDTKSNITVPLTIGGRVWGAVSFATVRNERHWTLALVARLQVVALIFANVLARQRADEALRTMLQENTSLRERLREENVYLRRELHAFTAAPAIVSQSPGFRSVLDQARQAARTATHVLLTGEVGTGKTLLASRIHDLSSRRDRALVHVNCATRVAPWSDRDLAGADTYDDAGTRWLGWLEFANGSTVFLDEIADLPFDMQAALVRVLRDRQIQLRGRPAPLPMDVRIIAATRRDLTWCLAEGMFRDDLYYQLNVFEIHVPSLRERPEDIEPLMWRFIDEFSEVYGKPIDSVDKESVAALLRYPWPGNARELRNVVERAVILATGRTVRVPLPQTRTKPRRPPRPSR